MLPSNNIQSIIGATLYGRDKAKIGRVDQVLVDAGDGHPTWAVLHAGLLGRKNLFVPLGEATWEHDDVFVDLDKDDVKNAPQPDSEGGLTPEQELELHGYYARLRLDPDASPAADGDHRESEGAHLGAGTDRDHHHHDSDAHGDHPGVSTDHHGADTDHDDTARPATAATPQAVGPTIAPPPEAAVPTARTMPAMTQVADPTSAAAPIGTTTAATAPAPLPTAAPATAPAFHRDPVENTDDSPPPVPSSPDIDGPKHAEPLAAPRVDLPTTPAAPTNHNSDTGDARGGRTSGDDSAAPDQGRIVI